LGLFCDKAPLPGLKRSEENTHGAKKTKAMDVLKHTSEY
jgi:hypothetical protein